MTTPAFGLTVWFDVSVVGLGTADDHQLGRWSSCTGLGVEFGAEEFGEGGRYGSPAVLPGRIKYGRVTLKRAVCATDSPRVRRWLELVAANWVNSGKPAADYAGVELVIQLRNSPQSAGKAIQVWRLRNAIPVSWSGPALAATGGEVATEQLVLLHQGFLDPAAPDSASSAANGSDGKLKLASVTQPGKAVVFQYTPETVKLTRKHEIRSQTTASTAELRLTRPARTKIALGQLRVDGAAEVKATLGQLGAWMQPIPPQQPAASMPEKPAGTKKDDGAKHGRLELLRLTLGSAGDGISQDVILTSLDVTYDRFTPAGDPCRALVLLTLEEFGATGSGEQPARATTAGSSSGRRRLDDARPSS